MDRHHDKFILKNNKREDYSFTQREEYVVESLQASTDVGRCL